MRSGRNESGYLIVLCLVVVIVFSAIGLSVGQVITAKYASTKRATYVANATMVAEAGISDTIAQFSSNINFGGYPDGARKVFFNNADQGKGEYSTSVSAPAPNTRVITSTGYVYRNPASTANEIKKTLKVVAKAQINPTQYSVFAGPGGLIVGSFVTVRGANLYVSGKVTIESFGSIGTLTEPVNLKVANIACRAGGVGSQYPVACTDQPLSIAGFLGTIYGTVCATNQVSTGGISPGTTGQGLIAGCIAPSGSMPVFDKQGFVDSMSTPAKAPATAVCSLPFNNEATWDANTIYSGSVSFNTICNKVNVKGNIYIKGNLTTNLFTHFVVDESLTQPPTIVVNGDVNINHSRVSANSSGVPMRIISFDSANSGCTTSDSCNSLSSYTDIYNSTNRETASCKGVPSGDMPGLILQAYFGKVHVDNGCQLGSVAGQTVDFDFFGGTSLVGQQSLDGTVTYDGWKIVDYQQTF